MTDLRLLRFSTHRDTEPAVHTTRRAPEPALSATLDFMRSLWAVDHALQSTSKRMEHRCGLTGPQRLVIRIVGQFPGATAGTIASVLQVHPSTLTGILRRLQTRGLIVRRADPLDARRALFELTPAGTEANEVDEGTPEAAVSRAMHAVSPEDIDAARRVLGAVTSALSDLVAQDQHAQAAHLSKRPNSVSVPTQSERAA